MKEIDKPQNRYTHHSDLYADMFQLEKQNKSKKRKQTDIHMPEKLFSPKKKSKKDKDITKTILKPSLNKNLESEHTSSDSENSESGPTVPLPKIIKTEKSKRKSTKSDDSGSEETMPRPILVKRERKLNKKSRKNKNSESETEHTSSNSENSDSGPMLPLPKIIKSEETRKSTKSDDSDSSEQTVPYPMIIKHEPQISKKLNRDKNRMSNKIKKHSPNKNFESEHTSSNSENSESGPTVPLPKIIKTEKSKRKSTKSDDSGSEETMPRPMLVKREQKLNKKSRKNKNSESESEHTNSNSENSGPMLSLPKIIKSEETKRKSTKSDNSDSSVETVPRPINIKHEPQISKSKSDNSDSNTSTSEGESGPENYVSETVRSKMEYLNSSTEKISQKKKSLLESVQSKYPNVAKQLIALDIPQTKNCFLLRVPKTIDPSKLVHLPWDLDKNLKFKLLNQKDKYIIQPLNENPDPCYVIGQDAKVLNINKIYSVTKHISKNQGINFELPTKTTVPLPDNIKTRHPLFGINYGDQIKLRKDVKHRLKEAVKNLKKQNLKEIKKKYTKKVKKEIEESSSELILDMLNSHTSRKR